MIKLLVLEAAGSTDSARKQPEMLVDMQQDMGKIAGCGRANVSQAGVKSWAPLTQKVSDWHDFILRFVVQVSALESLGGDKSPSDWSRRSKIQSYWKDLSGVSHIGCVAVQLVCGWYQGTIRGLPYLLQVMCSASARE